MALQEAIKHFTALMDEGRGMNEQQRATFQNIHQGYPSDAIVRFLKAREWNVPKAHKMLMDCLNWRLQNEIDNILSKPIVPVDLYRAVRDSQLIGVSGYSKEVVKGGVTRMKEHLSVSHKNVVYCANVSDKSLLDVRQSLEVMFTSTQWLNFSWRKIPEGKEIRRLILNDKFWASVTYAILSTRPLVQVLRLMDAEKKPAMSFIYNAMDEAKELIAHNLGGEEASYKEIWDIIDARWEDRPGRSGSSWDDQLRICSRICPILLQVIFCTYRPGRLRTSFRPIGTVENVGLRIVLGTVQDDPKWFDRPKTIWRSAGPI
ncbi:hypothetical protein KFK09_017423 [Dendrobium nobile]|uniref:CRAL/TRIO N-terminal domain-containing protein n=1 Tax=Dendrobium nobile TaxID=94219 RepID=A0A8T3B294_DENNO|nr:hypothetical protein KFK09_017423 [Dendrobium nobile]